MPELDLIHIIFNGGQSDESQGMVSLQKKTWLFYTWGKFSGHDANGDAGVETLGITDDDFKLLLSDGDDPSRYRDLANWDHVVELLTCPAFRLGEQLGGKEVLPIELLVVVRGKATGQQVRQLERIVGHKASDVSSVGGNTDVLFHQKTEVDAAKLGARIGVEIEKLTFVEAMSINPPKR
jgi:hypothetical protein